MLATQRKPTSLLCCFLLTVGLQLTEEEREYSLYEAVSGIRSFINSFVHYIKCVKENSKLRALKTKKH